MIFGNDDDFKYTNIGFEQSQSDNSIPTEQNAPQAENSAGIDDYATQNNFARTNCEPAQNDAQNLEHPQNDFANGVSTQPQINLHESYLHNTQNDDAINATPNNMEESDISERTTSEQNANTAHTQSEQTRISTRLTTSCFSDTTYEQSEHTQSASLAHPNTALTPEHTQSVDNRTHTASATTSITPPFGDDMDFVSLASESNPAIFGSDTDFISLASDSDSTPSQSTDSYNIYQNAESANDGMSHDIETYDSVLDKILADAHTQGVAFATQVFGDENTFLCSQAESAYENEYYSEVYSDTTLPTYENVESANAPHAHTNNSAPEQYANINSATNERYANIDNDALSTTFTDTANRQAFVQKFDALVENLLNLCTPNSVEVAGLNTRNCGRISIGNPYASYEIQRPDNCPRDLYARFCPCNNNKPDHHEDCKHDCDCGQGGWHFDNKPCFNEGGHKPPRPCDRFDEKCNNHEHCDSCHGGCKPSCGCKPPCGGGGSSKFPPKPKMTAERLSRKIYQQFIFVGSQLANLIPQTECPPRAEELRQIKCAIDTLGGATLAVHKAICASDAVIMQSQCECERNYEKLFRELITSLSIIIDNLICLQKFVNNKVIYNTIILITFATITQQNRLLNLV